MCLCDFVAIGQPFSFWLERGWEVLGKFVRCSGEAELVAVKFSVFEGLEVMRGTHAWTACSLPVMPGLVFLRGVGSDFQSPHHEIHQPLPIIKIEIGRQGL